jgi:hypothetical protein
MGLSSARRGIVLCALYSHFVAVTCFLCSGRCQAQEHGHITSALPTIVLSSARTTDNTSMAAFANRMNRADCNAGPAYSRQPISVEAIAGAKVKRIVVGHIDQSQTPIRPEQIQNIVERVWTGTFQTRSCHILWAEATFWTLQAELEFEDGSVGLLLTDGHHVALRDRNGNNWFLRLLPAAQ